MFAGDKNRNIIQKTIKAYKKQNDHRKELLQKVVVIEEREKNSVINELSEEYNEDLSLFFDSCSYTIYRNSPEYPYCSILFYDHNSTPILPIGITYNFLPIGIAYTYDDKSTLSIYGYFIGNISNHNTKFDDLMVAIGYAIEEKQ